MLASPDNVFSARPDDIRSLPRTLLDGYSITLLPASAFNDSCAVPYWSLIYEIVFYAVMYGVILIGLLRQAIVNALVLWAAVIVFVCQFAHSFPSDIAAMLAGKWILVSPANFEFIAGALYGLVGWEARRRPIR